MSVEGPGRPRVTATRTPVVVLELGARKLEVFGAVFPSGARYVYVQPFGSDYALELELEPADVAKLTRALDGALRAALAMPKPAKPVDAEEAQ